MKGKKVPAFQNPASSRLKENNYIRVNGISPNCGYREYYIAESISDIDSQIKSLHKRASAIENSAKGLEGQKTYKYWFNGAKSSATVIKE